MGNPRRAGVYSHADHVPCYASKTTFSVRSRTNGHVRVFLKNLIWHLSGKSLVTNPCSFGRWCNLLAENQPVVVQHLSDRADDKVLMIHVFSKRTALTNMAELHNGHHRGLELALSAKVRTVVAKWSTQKPVL